MTLLATVAVTWGGWLLLGGSLFWVGSPSMGRVAPVGSLVATTPLPHDATLHLGEIIVFRPGGDHGAVFVHRVAQLLPGGGIRTKGDLNALDDPWTIRRADVIGTPDAIIPAIGWLYTWATWLFLGAGVLVATCLSFRFRARQWLVALGPVVLLGIPLLRDRPLIGGFLYGSGRHGNHVVARIVDTGVLPVRFLPHGGPAVLAHPGQEVLVRGSAAADQAVMEVRIAAALTGWQWAAIALACLTPLLLVEYVRWQADRRNRSAESATVGAGADEPVDPTGAATADTPPVAVMATGTTGPATTAAAATARRYAARLRARPAAGGRTGREGSLTRHPRAVARSIPATRGTRRPTGPVRSSPHRHPGSPTGTTPVVGVVHAAPAAPAAPAGHGDDAVPSTATAAATAAAPATGRSTRPSPPAPSSTAAGPVPTRHRPRRLRPRRPRDEAPGRRAPALKRGVGSPDTRESRQTGGS